MSRQATIHRGESALTRNLIFARDGGTTCDFGLVVSHDGLQFQEPVKGHVFLSSEQSPATPVAGKKYPTILCQAGGILNVGDETRIYHGRWRNAGENSAEYHAEVGLATLPRDRWGGLGLVPGANAGSVWSAPITLPQQGCRISLNAESAKSLRIELADEQFVLLDEFSGDKSGRCSSDSGLDCAVEWPAGKLASLAGKTIRLRIHVAKHAVEPRLYAVYVNVLQ